MTSRSEQLSSQFTNQFTNPFSNQFSTQLTSQLDIVQSWGSRAIDSAEQLISLNLRASRTSVEQATGTFKQLLDATNPRDIIAVGSRAQGQWHYLFDYGRELLSIASGAPLQAWSTQPAAHALPTLQLTQAPADNAAAREVAAAAIDTAETAADVIDNGSVAAYQAAADATEQLAAEAPAVEAKAAEEPAAEQPADVQAAAPQDVDVAPVVEVEQQFEVILDIVAEDGLSAKETPLVQALHEAAPSLVSVEHPAAAPVSLEANDHVELPVVTPIDAKPPVATPAATPAPTASKGRQARTRK
jgi:hypothetical protein